MRDLSLNSIITGGDCAVLQVAGEIDVYTAPTLREGIIDLVDKGVVHVITDMRNVDFLDSTGLGALVGSLKRLRTHEGSLRLVIDSDRIHRIFRITGLDRVFSIHPSLQEAITADGHWRAAVEDSGRSIEEWCHQHELLPD